MADKKLKTIFLIYIGGVLTLTVQCGAQNFSCPQECGTCEFNLQGEVIKANCRDIVIQQLPNSLESLYVTELLDFRKMPLGKFLSFILYEKENLTSLKIELYQLTSLEQDCFQHSPNLERLDLSRNKISKISEDSFTGLMNLTYLNLNQNSLQKLEDFEFRQLPALTELYISVNKIITLTEHVFSGLNNIVKIVLQTNQIASISENTFNSLATVQDINLQGNKLTSVNGQMFANLPSLKMLNLQMNEISVIDPASLVGTRNLFMLKMAENELTVVPAEVLQSIGNSNLTVSFARNQITELLDNALDGVILRKLSFTTNNISVINPLALHNSNIQMLDLKENSLQHLPENLMEDLSQSAEVLLRDNPWSCDCDIQSVVTLVKITDEELICASPQNYSGLLLSNVTDELREVCKWPTSDGSGVKGANSSKVGVIIGSVLGAAGFIATLAALIFRCCFLMRKVAPTDDDDDDKKDCEQPDIENNTTTVQYT